MKPTALQTLQKEHAALSASLHALSLILFCARWDQRAPDFPLIRSIVHYVEECSARHHLRERAFLFSKLRARAPWLRRQLDDLEDDHGRIERMIGGVRQALDEFEQGGEPRRLAFEAGVRDFVEFHVTHIAFEESEIMPLAEKALTVDYWTELEMALCSLTSAAGSADGDDLCDALRLRWHALDRSGDSANRAHEAATPVG
jgi:hemerythrin-like domain-containing protein